MGEFSDEWSAKRRTKIWGTTRGRGDAVRGGLRAILGPSRAGALTTTFTSSQGLLLAIPVMFKIAGDLCACT